MKMKPSYVIDKIATQIANKKDRNWGNPTEEDKWEALMQFLDENLEGVEYPEMSPDEIAYNR